MTSRTYSYTHSNQRHNSHTNPHRNPHTNPRRTHTAKIHAAEIHTPTDTALTPYLLQLINHGWRWVNLLILRSRINMRPTNVMPQNVLGRRVDSAGVVWAEYRLFSVQSTPPIITLLPARRVGYAFTCCNKLWADNQLSLVH